MRLKKLLSVRPIAGKLRGSFIKDQFYGFCLSLKWLKDKNQAGSKKAAWVSLPLKDGLAEGKRRGRAGKAAREIS